MTAIVVFWIMSMVFCALFCFALPAWDAHKAEQSENVSQTYTHTSVDSPRVRSQQPVT